MDLHIFAQCVCKLYALQKSNFTTRRKLINMLLKHLFVVDPIGLGVQSIVSENEMLMRV